MEFGTRDNQGEVRLLVVVVVVGESEKAGESL
jgi:hypothetical protein